MKNKNLFRFFESDSAPFILSTIYVNAYSDLNCVSINKNNITYICFQDFNEKKTKEEGYIYFNKQAKKYFDNFNRLLSTIDQEMIDFIKTKKYKSLIDKFIEFLSYYRYTEYFYTDKIYQDEKCKVDLKKLENIKTKARVFLNRFFNGNKSYLMKMSKYDKNFLYCKYEELNDYELNIDLDITNRCNYVYTKNSLTIDDGVVSDYLDILNSGINSNVINGIGASKGIVSGYAYNLVANFTNFDQLENIIDSIPNNVILVSETTSPDIVRACSKAIGIITNQGGLGSHAAIISRELGIPCVVGTKNATKLIKTGDYVTINGLTGEVLLDNTKKYVYSFSEICDNMKDIVGEKAYSLAKLNKKNIKIAKGLVITSMFWEDYSKERDINLINKISKEILMKLDVDSYAVRSSAIGEDSSNHSWAGCFDTFLNVSKKDLSKAIIECGQSLNNDRVRAYTKLSNYDVSIDKIGIIVQEYIKGDVNGVCFSVNPVTGDNEIVIEVTKNSQVVDGVGEPETLYISKKGDALLRSSLISTKTLKELINYVKQIEKIWDRPVDVEFAIRDKNIYFMQAREITTI